MVSAMARFGNRSEAHAFHESARLGKITAGQQRGILFVFDSIWANTNTVLLTFSPLVELPMFIPLALS
jgi:hypothetical protein